MMAAATADPVVPVVNEVVTWLEDETKLLSELADVVDAKAIGKAWAAGLIEFGRRTYCTVGFVGETPGTEAEGSICIIEGGEEWTGEKNKDGNRHKAYRDMAMEVLPFCERYERADVPMVAKTDPKSGQTTYHRPVVKRKEAEELLGLRVRLTDKGMSLLSA